MRPLYAIAPLALLLVFFGPTPHETNQALAAFKSRLTEPKAPQHTDMVHNAAPVKPGLVGNTTAFSANHTGKVIEASFVH
jgi:hypothetical protein